MRTALTKLVELIIWIAVCAGIPFVFLLVFLGLGRLSKWW